MATIKPIESGAVSFPYPPVSDRLLTFFKRYTVFSRAKSSLTFAP